MILLRREFEFLQKISCNCHNVHGSAISRNFLRHMNGARIICFKQKCYTFQEKKMFTRMSSVLLKLNSFCFLFFFKKKTLSIETFITIATGYVHCISFEKSAKKSNDFRSTNDVIAFFLIRRSKRLRFQEDPNDMHSKTEKGNRR